jgi:hypothetical protein
MHEESKTRKLERLKIQSPANRKFAAEEAKKKSIIPQDRENFTAALTET